MLLSFSLLMFLCESKVKSQSPTTWRINDTVEEKPFLLLMAKPDYPVAAGQSVDLQCRAVTQEEPVELSWERLKDQAWISAGMGRQLALTKPEESGLYRCLASDKRWFSRNHTVCIVAVHTTVREHLGTSAFVCSLLALIAIFAVVFWLGWQRRHGTLITGNVTAKGFPGTEQPPKEGWPRAETDVYINFTSTRRNYTDLNPTTVVEDNVYSSLS